MIHHTHHITKSLYATQPAVGTGMQSWRNKQWSAESSFDIGSDGSSLAMIYHRCFERDKLWKMGEETQVWDLG